MMKDLRLGFQFMRYANKMQTIIVLSIVEILCGFYLMNPSIHILNIFSGYLLIGGPYLFAGSYQKVNMSNLVLSSPKRRRMEVQILTLLNVASVVIGFSLFSIALLIEFWLNGSSSYYIGLHSTAFYYVGFDYMVLGVIYIMFFIRTALSYKYSILSIVMAIIEFLAILLSCITIPDSTMKSIPVSLGVGIAAVCIIIGSFAFFSLSKRLYRIPMDKHTVKSTLQEIK